MKLPVYLIALVLITSSCSYNVYDMNRGDLKTPKKDTYEVEYVTDIPPGTTATITYMGPKNTKYAEKLYTGKLDKTFTLKSGTDCYFTVDVSLPKTTPASSLHTFVKVDGETITDQTQTNKNAKFSFTFKLP